MWVGVGKGREALERVADKAESAVVSAGLPAESRKFSAHLTIARLRQPESIAQFLSKARKVDARTEVREVILYRSELGVVTHGTQSWRRFRCLRGEARSRREEPRGRSVFRSR